MSLQAQDVHDPLRCGTPAKAACGPDSELRKALTRESDATARAFHTVGGVDETQVDVGIAHGKVIKRCIDSGANAAENSTGMWTKSTGRPAAVTPRFASATATPRSFMANMWALSELWPGLCPWEP